MEIIKATNPIPPKEITVEFEHPVTIKGEKIKEVTLRKPKVKDMRRYSEIKGTEAVKEIWFISALSGATVSELEEFDSDQYELMQEAVKNFQSSVTQSVE